MATILVIDDELGIKVEVRDVENTALAESIKSGDWDMATQAWTTLGDHGVLLSGQIGPDGAANHAGLEPATVPALLEQLRGRAGLRLRRRGAERLRHDLRQRRARRRRCGRTRPCRPGQAG